MCDPIMNFEDMSVQEKTILMCMERIDKLEDRANKLEAEFEEKTRITLLNTIVACDMLEHIVYDVFFFLCGVNVNERKGKVCKQVIRDILPNYIGSASSTPRARQMAQMFTVSSNGITGVDLYRFLSTWSVDELEAYWAYRLQWVGWIDK